jgi:RNA polymerase sigma-70 factor, ECF subfamily
MPRSHLSPAPSETEIVDGLRNGDRAAWNALCSQYGDQLWRYVFRLVGRDENVVADVFQETMLAVAKSGRAISRDTRLWPWLSRIGHNQAALFWRKHYRDRDIATDVGSVATQVNSSPVESALRGETVDAVRQLLSQMSPDHVSLLVAKYLDGKSVDQMVNDSGGTTEAVRSKLARARRDFRERYESMTSERHKTPALRDVSTEKGEL